MQQNAKRTDFRRYPGRQLPYGVVSGGDVAVGGVSGTSDPGSIWEFWVFVACAEAAGGAGGVSTELVIAAVCVD